MKKKQNEQSIGFILRLFITLGFSAFPLAVCLSITEVITRSNTIAEEFCTLEDEVYQEISSNAEEWNEYLHSSVSNGILFFSIPSGRKYVANGTRDTTFFVIFKDMRDEPFGKAGYSYGLPLLDRRYSVNLLAENIYCYHL